MTSKPDSSFYIKGGICGIIGTLSYILAMMVPFSPVVTFILAMMWPILSVIFAFSVYKYIAFNRQSSNNQLAFLFTCIAFILVSIMLSVQLVVRTGLAEAITNAVGAEKDSLVLISRSLRWVDLGVDLAWDMFIGLGLIFLSLVLRGHPKFGIWWSIPLALLAIAVVVTNLYTFPDPPGSSGLFDVGPLIGTYMIIFASRMVYLSAQMRKTSR